MKCLITRASTLNRWDRDGIKHEDDESTSPCHEATLESITDYHGKKQIRYTIDINDLKQMDDIQERYSCNLFVTLDRECDGFATIVIMDEELSERQYYGIPKMYVEMPFPEKYFEPYNPLNPPRLEFNLRKWVDFLKTHTLMDVTKEVYEKELK
ncbi:MAG: hypothetical protein IKL53_06855 [Lachnospiraceae bacterium]|nr:hypothetical protein [Lachnospiraceae bacterium]